ncbi:MAG: Replication initiator protein A [Hylemonella sp.]|nr:Replication initiator protein A [Hylemonella sp.]HPW28101.1 plasmid replication initiator TrfA [Rhodoferax sp.]
MRQKRTFEENLALVKARGQPAAALQPVGANRPLDVQLPLWAKVCRGVPNSVLRSALFGVVRRGPRSFQQRVQKASVDGVKIIHTGPQLDQADLDVWEQSLQLARTGGLGCRIQFTASQFLKCIGRGNGKSQHEWLKGAFARLAASVVEIKDGHRAYFGAILSHGGRDDQSGRYVIEMNPKLIELYGLDGWSSVEFGQRMALKKRPLAQWLHGYYSSHAKPFPVKVETLHRLCGSQNSSLKGFKQDLKSALEKLEEVTNWTWKIDASDLVHLSKLPTASQSRHLLKRGRSRGQP